MNKETQPPTNSPELFSSTVTPEDHDLGFKDCPLNYMRGEPKEGWPTTARVTPIGNRQARAAYMEMASALDPFPFLKRCLPEEFRDEAVLERLTPDCIGRLTDVAFEMTFGAAEMQKMKNIATEMLAKLVPLARV